MTFSSPKKMFDLYVDMGNSHIKWCVSTGETQTFHHDSIKNFSAQNPLVEAMRQSHQNYACCPSHHPKYSEFRRLFESFSVNWLTKVPPSPAFEIGYQCPDSYGIDRYLSLLHVMDEAPLILVDCGSAITIDMMLSKQQHLGGWILPGMQTSQQQFKQYGLSVDNSPHVAHQPHQNSLGHNTQEAITYGYRLMVVGFLQKIAETSPQYGLKNPRLMLTGGDAQSLLPDLSHHWQYYPHTVLQGLIKHHVRQ